MPMSFDMAGCARWVSFVTLRAHLMLEAIRSSFELTVEPSWAKYSARHRSVPASTWDNRPRGEILRPATAEDRELETRIDADRARLRALARS